MKTLPLMCLLGFALTALIPTAAPGDEKRVGKPKLEDFLRFVEDEDAGRLQTSIATYRNGKGAEVQVVAAVHIGDAEYYADLNKVFADYEALLFEMVGGRDGLKEEDLKGTGGIRALQGMIGRTLELDFQLDGIDYTAENFVHADMDAATFARRLKKQNINLFALMNKVSKWEKERAMERKAKGLPEPDMGLFAVVQALLFGGGKDLKLSLARQFGDLNGFLAEMEDEGAVIIGERNAVALKILERELTEGKMKIGIFYGAAHLPDMEAKLAGMGFRRTGLTWKTAWFVPKKAGAKGGGDGGKKPPAVEVEPAEKPKIDRKSPVEIDEKNATAPGRRIGKDRLGRHRRIRPAA